MVLRMDVPTPTDASAEVRLLADDGPAGASDAPRPPSPASVTEDPETDDAIVVQAPAPITAASALVATAQDLATRPLTRPGDVAEVMPGLFAVQHAGGGKASQYFVRGFDADHGTDVALFVDGVPVNMVSHAHGQGYADLHFLIPELVDHVDVRKGPYEVVDGDLATAGVVDMTLIDRVEETRATATVGAFGTLRGVAIAGMGDPSAGAVLAAEVYATDGPFETPEALSRVNLFAKGSVRRGTATYTLGASQYAADWTASGQIPLRAVEDGSLDRFGTMDPTDGGVSARRQAWASAQLDGKDSALRVAGYVGSYALDLWSNFTFVAEHPDVGDQFLQRDNRTFSGLDAAWTTRQRLGEVRFTTRLGAQARHDDATTGLAWTQARVPWQSTVDADLDEGRAGAYLREEVAWRWLRVVGGARLDHFTFQVQDHLDAANTGARGASIVSPKASVVVSPHRIVDLYANVGRGFHSNDARGVVRAVDPADPLTAALGYELGSRLHGGWGQLALAAWALDLDAETVWVGDAGTTELRGPTARRGVDGSLRVSPLAWLQGDLDVTVADATYVDNAGNGGAVALAPTFTLSGGFGVLHPSGASAGARVRHIGERPATEDGSLVAEAFTVVDAEAGYRWRGVSLAVQVDNVLDAPWREVQFANESRIAGEDAPVQDIHFTPGWPRTVMVTLGVAR
jgi:hypothetical protein